MNIAIPESPRGLMGKIFSGKGKAKPLINKDDSFRGFWSKNAQFPRDNLQMKTTTYLPIPGFPESYPYRGMYGDGERDALRRHHRPSLPWSIGMKKKERRG